MKNEQNKECDFDNVHIKSLTTHQDERGFFREILRIPNGSNLLENTIGQISHSEVYPGIVKAWHGHVNQYQWTYIIKGILMVALADKRKNSSTYNKVYSFICGGINKPIVYGFPPGVYHGYRNLGDTCQITYFTSGQYDINDELRIDPFSDEIKFNWSLKYK